MKRARIAVDGRALAETAGGLKRYAGEVLSLLPGLAPDLEWQLISTRRVPLPHDDFSLTVLPGSINALARPLWEDYGLTRILDNRSSHLLFSPYGIVPNVRIPVVAMVHDLQALRFPATLRWHHRRYWKRVARRLPRARKVLTNSRTTANDVATLTSVPVDRITVAHLAASAAFRPVEEGRIQAVLRECALRPPYVLSVGAGTRRKKLAPVVDAVAAIPGLTLATVGRNQGGGESLHLGHVPDNILAALISGALAVVCPSQLEGFGLPVIEAMACGTPVVASFTPAAEEVAGDAAILIRDGDGTAWRAALSALHHNPELCDTYRDAGLVRSRDFSWQKTARITLDAIRSVLPRAPTGE